VPDQTSDRLGPAGRALSIALRRSLLASGRLRRVRAATARGRRRRDCDRADRSSEPVHHHGDHDTVDDIQFLPRPVQRPGVPMWIAGFPGNVKPMRRAARYDGFFPANLQHPDQPAEVVATVAELRGGATGQFDIVVGLPAGVDPAAHVEAGASRHGPAPAPPDPLPITEEIAARQRHPAVDAKRA
jgi:alkanesulfonate monooxygenase SsuD/methylene tetrahydromethanopterin reductase-like flavin-dependent oxidoreductase (luciferase family)